MRRYTDVAPLTSRKGLLVGIRWMYPIRRFNDSQKEVRSAERRFLASLDLNGLGA